MDKIQYKEIDSTLEDDMIEENVDISLNNDIDCVEVTQHTTESISMELSEQNNTINDGPDENNIENDDVEMLEQSTIVNDVVDMTEDNSAFDNEIEIPKQNIEHNRKVIDVIDITKDNSAFDNEIEIPKQNIEHNRKVIDVIDITKDNSAFDNEIEIPKQNIEHNRKVIDVIDMTKDNSAFDNEIEILKQNSKVNDVIDMTEDNSAFDNKIEIPKQNIEHNSKIIDVIDITKDNSAFDNEIEIPKQNSKANDEIDMPKNNNLLSNRMEITKVNKCVNKKISLGALFKIPQQNKQNVANKIKIIEKKCSENDKMEICDGNSAFINEIEIPNQITKSNDEIDIPKNNKPFFKRMEISEINKFVGNKVPLGVPIPNLPKPVGDKFIIVKNTPKKPEQRVPIVKKVMSTMVLNKSTNATPHSGQIKKGLNFEKIAVIKSDPSIVKVNPSVLARKFQNQTSIISRPGTSIINPQTKITNFMSNSNANPINYGNVIKANQDLKLKFANAPNSKMLVVPRTNTNFVLQPVKRVQSEVKSLVPNSLISPVISSVSSAVSLPVNQVQNLIVSKPEIPKMIGVPSARVTKFVAKMQKLPDGKYKVMPAQGEVPPGLENLFKPNTEFIKNNISLKPANSTTNELNKPQYFIRMGTPPMNFQQFSNFKATNNLRPQFKVMPRQQLNTNVKTINYDNLNTIKKTIPLTYVKKNTINQPAKYVIDNNIIRNKKNDKQEISTSSGFVKLTSSTTNSIVKLNDLQNKIPLQCNIGMKEGQKSMFVKVLKNNDDESDRAITTTATGEKIRAFASEAHIPKIVSFCSTAQPTNKLRILKKKPANLKKLTAEKTGLPRTCKYEFCDTLVEGLPKDSLIDDLYCSAQCKKFDTKLMLASEKKPSVVKNNDEDTSSIKQPMIDRRMLLLRLKNRINKRKQKLIPYNDEKEPTIYKPLDEIKIESDEEMPIITLKDDEPISKPQDTPIIDESSKPVEKVTTLTLQINLELMLKYLKKLPLKPAPRNLFDKPFPTENHFFKIGQKLEGIDPGHEALFCVMTVINIIGYRIKLHFDGYPNIYDFWVNADCPDIFYAKWCEKNSRSLEPPKNYKKKFDWNDYLQKKLAFSAPKWCFASTKILANSKPHKFCVGQKLEAIDKLTRTQPKQLICVATIADILGDRIRIHFDGWSDDFDYWTDITSNNIHPVGWCSKNGRILSAPSGYKYPKGRKFFSWNEYLKETKSEPVPEDAFVRKPLREFTVDMAIEVVDIANPVLIRVAKIVDIKGDEIKIIYDGFDVSHAYWIEDDNPNIHPIGWCLKTGHPLEIPSIKRAGRCGIIGCNGKGNVNFSLPCHNEIRGCPYNSKSWKNLVNGLIYIPDRLKKDSQLLQPYDEATSSNTSDIKLENEDSECEKQEIENLKRREERIKQIKLNKKLMKMEKQKQLRDKIKLKKHLAALDMFGIRRTSATTIKPITTKRYIQILNDIELRDETDWTYLNNDNNGPLSLAKRNKEISRRNVLVGIPNVTAKTVESWSVREVAAFADRVLINSSRYRSPEDQVFVSNIFSEHQIDGKMFLSLTQDYLLQTLNLTLGPALKIANAIRVLKTRVP